LTPIGSITAQLGERVTNLGRRQNRSQDRGAIRLHASETQASIAATNLAERNKPQWRALRWHFFCCSCRLTSSALPSPSNAVSTGQRLQKVHKESGWEQSLPSLVRRSDRGARIPRGSILHNMTRPAAHHPSIERIGL